MKIKNLYKGEDFKSLLIFTSKIGNDVTLTQGPGGNISMKMKRHILVKKSGFKMSDAMTMEIFVPLIWIRIRIISIIHFWILTNFFTKKVPSIETYLHLAFPNKYVLHIHSIDSVGIAIRKDYKSLFRNFPNILCVDYQNPGKALFKAIKKIPDLQNAYVLVLQNHGLVLFGNSLAEIESKMSYFKSAVESLNLNKPFLGPKQNHSLNQIQGFLTPDHATFSSHLKNLDLLEEKTTFEWVHDLKFALEESLKRVPALELLNVISSESGTKISNWRSEKRRISLND